MTTVKVEPRTITIKLTLDANEAAHITAYLRQYGGKIKTKDLNEVDTFRSSIIDILRKG